MHDAWLAGSAIFLLLIFFTFCVRAEPDIGNEPPVRALLVPVLETTLSSRMAGRITKINGREGDSFRKGEKLIEFDCTIQHSQLKKSRAKLLGAQKTHESNLRLREYDSVSELEIGLSAAEVQSAQADVEIIKAKLMRCNIHAPFDGRIVELHAHPYESVSEHQPLMGILDDSRLEVQLYIPSWWLTWVKNDTVFEIAVDETGKTYTARVTRLGARVDSASQSLAITAIINSEHKDLLSGMSGTAIFEIPGKQ
ncbi:MAG: efflux RND transporter periplasmic adaptor subunit [Gammaproteobacteria bacterium]